MASLLTLDEKIFNQLALVSDAEAIPEQAPFNPNSEVERTKAQELAVATGDPVDVIEAERAIGNDRAEVMAKTNSDGFSYEGVIQKGYDDKLTPEQVAKIIEDRQAKGQDMSLSEYMLIQSLMLNDNDINPYAARTITNMEIWNRMMQKEFEGNDQSGWSKLTTFLDVNVLREMTIGALENVTFRSNREGSDIRGAFNSLPPDEFKLWAEEYIQERKQEGIFSEDSIWNLYKAANDATYLGDDPMAPANFIFGAVDLATLGTSAAARTGAKAAGIAIKAAQNAGTTGAEVAGKISGLVKARRPVDVVAVLGDEVQAAETAVKMVDDAGVQTDVVNAGRTLTSDLDPVPGPATRPAGGTVRDVTRKNIITEQLEEVNRRGSFGEYVPTPVLKAAADSIATRISERVNDVVADVKYIRDEGSDDFKAVIRIGQDGSGAAFRRKMDAEAIAAKDPSFKVVPKEEGRGWYVETEERINVLGLPEAGEVLAKSNFISDTINKVFGASTVRLGDKLGGKFLQAEAGGAIVGEIIKPYQKIINSLKGRETQNLSEFMTQLRDGSLSHLRKAPDRQSFEAMYKTMYGQTPSKATADAYEALIDINDASWHIKASARLKRVVAEGGVYADFTDDFGDVVYRVERNQVPESELIYDIKANKSIRKDKLTADQIVFKVPNVFLDHLYVTGVKRVRVAERVDVMPYNIGGPRTNSEFRWFVGFIKDQALASGNRISTGFKTLLGSFGKDQAETAVRQINNISAKIDELLTARNLDGIADLTLSKAEFDELGDFIRANNAWNPHITDLDHLQKFAAKYKFNFRRPVALKARDEKVTMLDAGQDPSAFGLNTADVVGTRINMKRGDTPPMEFGGKAAVNESPITNIANQFGSEVFGYANRAASQNAVVGWVKLAEKSGVVTFPDHLPKNDFLGRFLEAKVSKSGKYNDLAAQLREQQDVIKRRLNQPTWLSDKWESFTNTATEFVFEKTGKKMNFSEADPQGQLMKVGFYSKFGFFNPDQFVLQGLHAATIIAISPLQGTKAASLTPSLLVLTSRRLSPKAKEMALKRLAAVSPISEEDLRSLVRYIEESGRHIVDNQVIELQGPQKFGAASTLPGKAVDGVNRFLDKSTLFFKEGERASRMTGLATAWLEHRARRPNIDPLSSEGRLWITNREQDLTFRMSSQSRSMIQSGAMRVPTQWLTFSVRALENIVVGRNFTAAERFRMAMVMGPMYGLVGVGFGGSAGWIIEKLGYDPDTPEAVAAYNNIKYGFVDALLSELVGIDTAYANRVAPIEGIFDTFKKLFSEEFGTVVFGPSGEIASDMATVGISAIKSMFAGRTEFVRDDLNQLLRNLSTYDKIVKIRELIETGNYRSKTHRVAVSGLPPEAAASVLFGATPAPVQNYYDYQEMVYKKNDLYKEVQKRVQEKARLALPLLTNGDKDDMIKGSKIWQEINDEIWSSPLSNQLKVSIQKSIVNAGSIPEIMRNAVRLGLGNEGLLIQQQIR